MVRPSLQPALFAGDANRFFAKLILSGLPRIPDKTKGFVFNGNKLS
jgi:hypothetical protein